MKKIINFFVQIAYHWWIFWSNIRFRKVERFNNTILPEDYVSNLDKINILTKKLYSHFDYTPDGIDQLFDAIIPPPQAYQKYLLDKLKDDCDGFHSLLLQCLRASQIECYLLAVNAIGSGHCVLVFYLDGKWHVNDYTTIYDGYDKLQDAINAYNEKFVKIYSGAKSKVFGNTIIDYNFKKGKFKLLSIKKAEKN